MAHGKLTEALMAAGEWPRGNKHSRKNTAGNYNKAGRRASLPRDAQDPYKSKGKYGCKY